MEDTQIIMFQFGLAIARAHPEMYDRFSKMSLADVGTKINEMYNVEITKGMDLKDLLLIIDIINNKS